MTRIKISISELERAYQTETPDFPKYATQLMNLANNDAQGTRPKIVGKVTDLIEEFPGSGLAEWEEWYLRKHPESISAASEKIADMLTNFRDVLTRIDQEMIRKWVRDLVIVKTFLGLKCQKAILMKLSELRSAPFRLATPEEESQGIDGYVGDQPVSIKPTSFRIKPQLPEIVPCPIVYYEKTKDGLILEIDETEIPPRRNL
jgi:hypothetical protein